MPVLVQWKWKEETKIFLVIFHIYNDYSVDNIRTSKMRFESEEEPSRKVYVSLPNEFPIGSPHYIKYAATVHTWAPSHPEIAPLMQVLCYANYNKWDERK